jgi:serine/threonine protein kinase
MISEQLVNTLRPGSVFRSWLIEILGDKIINKNCYVNVYKIFPTSHTVCRYEFVGEDYSVISKFLAEPVGWKKHKHPSNVMEKEYEMLKKLENIIDIPKPIEIKKEFHCALVTEYVHGNNLYHYMYENYKLYDKLTLLACTLKRLHNHTFSEYSKEKEFAHFHRVLDHIYLDTSSREKFNRLLGEWWYSPYLDLQRGCIIHGDANPQNYIFNHDKLYIVDFESSYDQANFVHDLGIVSAELKNFFWYKTGKCEEAEPYIGHFLWQYAKNEDLFQKITKALPFFMALGLARISRLNLSPNYRDFILKEVEACLKL